MMAAIVVRLCTYALLLALGPTSAVMAAPTPAHPPVVQVLHNSFVSAEKFQHLQSFAQRQGVQLRHLNVEDCTPKALQRSEEHTSELQSLMRISYAVFCL